MTNIQTTVGQNLRLLRQARGQTQEKLAELVQVKSSYIGYLERGLRAPSLDLIARLSTALQVEPGALFTNFTENIDPIMGKLNALLEGKDPKSLYFLYNVAVAYFASLD